MEVPEESYPRLQVVSVLQQPLSRFGRPQKLALRMQGGMRVNSPVQLVLLFHVVVALNCFSSSRLNRSIFLSRSATLRPVKIGFLSKGPVKSRGATI